MSRVSLEPHAGRKRPGSWGRKDEEYIADFNLISRRYLDEEEYRIFRFHFLLGADWKLCTRRLGIDRGNFFHAVYRIEQKLGRIFRELQPYALFPLDDYFGGTSRYHLQVVGGTARSPEKATPPHLRFPMPLSKTA